MNRLPNSGKYPRLYAVANRPIRRSRVSLPLKHLAPVSAVDAADVCN